MMMGAGGLGAPPGQQPPAQQPPAQQPPAQQPVTAADEPTADPSGAVQAGSANAKKNLAFQKTMMGPVGGMGELLKEHGHPPADSPAGSTPDGDVSSAQSPGVSQPPGGFGPPPTSSGSFGSPAQSQSGYTPPPPDSVRPGSAPSAATSGFGEPSEGGYDNLQSGPPSGSFGSGGGGGSKTKYFIIAGVGCLVLLAIACAIGFFVMYKAFEEAKAEAEAQLEQMNSLGAGVQGELARLDLNASLSTLQVICDMDKSAEGARTSFHPEVFESLRGEACKVSRATVQAFSDSANSSIAPANPTLSDTSECYIFSSGGASITTCKYDGDTVITAMQGVDQVR